MNRVAAAPSPHFDGSWSQCAISESWRLSSNLKGDGNCSGCALGPVPLFTVGIEQFPSTVPPLLIRRTAECLFEALGRTLDDAKAALSSREFDHRLSLDRLQTRTKPARRAFQQGNDRTCALALAIEKGDETLQQLGQIVPGTDLKRNRSDGSDNELVARTPGLGNNDDGPGGVYAEKHLKYPVGILTADAHAHQDQNRTLFGLCIRGSRGGGTMIRGVLRRGGRAACAIRGAAGYEREGNDGKAGEDNFFHKYVCCSNVLLTMRG